MAGLAFGVDAARGAIAEQLAGLMGRQSADLLQTPILCRCRRWFLLRYTEDGCNDWGSAETGRRPMSKGIIRRHHMIVIQIKPILGGLQSHTQVIVRTDCLNRAR